MSLEMAVVIFNLVVGPLEMRNLLSGDNACTYYDQRYMTM